MSMHKVCPKCQTCDEVTETAFPSERYTRFTLSPQKNEKNKIILDWFDTEVEEE